MSAANRRHGLSTFVGGKIDLSGDSQITSQGNGQMGLFADNGGSVRVSKSTLTKNTMKDVALSFGTRAEFIDNEIGTITCDATVLIRGDLNCPAPYMTLPPHALQEYCLRYSGWYNVGVAPQQL